MEKSSKVSTEKQKYYRTKDWTEAALLLTFKTPIAAISREAGTTWFSFLDTANEARTLVSQYVMGDLTVNLRDFVDCQRRVKDLLHRRSDIPTPAPL